MADSYPVLLKKAIAADLDANGLAVYQPTTAYTNASTAVLPGVVTAGPELPTTFDRCIVLTTLTPFDEGRGNRVTPVQFTTRLKGGRTDAENQFEELRDHYHDRHNVLLGGLSFQKVLLNSSLFISADTQGRTGYFLTFHFSGRYIVP